MRKLYKCLTRSAARDVVRAGRQLLWEIRAAGMHARGVKRALQWRGPGLRLHIGCGAHVRDGWLNIDLHPSADLRLDGRRPLPFADSSADEIASEHFVEHLELEDACAFFSEAARVLRPGGRMTVAVPDAEAPLREYVAGDGPLLRQAREEGWHPAVATPLDQINVLFRQGQQHRYAWDAPTLLHYLRAAGFSSCISRPFDGSRDSERRRVGSLYVDAMR